MDVPLQIALRKWCELLDMHGGRDKIIRVTGYIFAMISDLPVIKCEQFYSLFGSHCMNTCLFTGNQKHSSVQEGYHNSQVI